MVRRSELLCCTVAKMCCGETSPCFRKASIRMPPIFPAPRTASPCLKICSATDASGKNQTAKWKVGERKGSALPQTFCHRNGHGQKDNHADWSQNRTRTSQKKTATGTGRRLCQFAEDLN